MAITANSFASLVGDTARSHGFRFRYRGLWTRIILSSWITRSSRFIRRYFGAVSAPTASAVLQAMAEAMRNSQRYAFASTHDVTLRFHALDFNRVTVQITDDGKGFVADPVNYGLGIRNSLLGRLKTAGGSVRIRSAPGHGCSVTLIAPLLPMGSGARPTELRFHRPDPTLVVGHTGGPQPRTAHPSGMTGHHNGAGLPAEMDHLMAAEDTPSTANTQPASTMFSSVEEVFMYYASTIWGRLTMTAIVPVLWIFTYNTAGGSTYPTRVIMCAVVLTAVLFPACLYPWHRPSPGYQLVMLVLSAILPALSLSALNLERYQSADTFILPFLVFLHLWLWSRGARLTALGCLTFSFTSFAWASLHYQIPPPMPWEVMARNIGTAGFFIASYVLMFKIYERVQTELESQGILRMMRQASHRALVARQRRVQEIDRETRTLLTQLAAGTDPQELQKDAAVTEEQLRDFIRADRLTIPPLRQTVREARSRGVRVRLADDSAGIHDLRTLINEANTIIAKAAPGDEVTVRALPPGKSHLGSVLISVDGQDTLHWVDLDTGIKKR